MSRRSHPDPIEKTLSESPSFSCCRPREIRAMSSYTTRIDLKAGRVLTREGEVGMELFVIVAGRALVERGGVALAVVESGAVIGEIALLRATTRTATVTAMTDMSVLVMSRSEVAAMRNLGIASSAWEHLDRMIEARLKVLEQVVERRADEAWSLEPGAAESTTSTSGGNASLPVATARPGHSYGPAAGTWHRGFARAGNTIRVGAGL